MDAKQAAALRKPFPASAIGKLPKGGVTLSFVGHAAVTDRLLQVDPEWTWEPFAVDEHGIPALDKSGNLWIRLTICGVTRIGVGDGKSAKEVVGDAIRNAAMRYGVALDLWAGAADLDAADDHRVEQAPTTTGELISDKQLKAMHTAFSNRGMTERDDRIKFAVAVIGRDIASSKELTRKEAGMVLDELATGQSDDPPEPFPPMTEPGGSDPWQT